MASFPTGPALRLANNQAPPAQDPAGEFFARLPLAILADRNLSDGSKLLVAAIADSARASGACTDSNEVLASKVGKDPATIPRLLRELERAEVIERDQRGPFRTIRLNFRFRGQMSDPGKSARVGQSSTLAPAPPLPGKSASQPRQDCQGSLAPAPPTLRLPRAEQEADQKSGAGPARVGQAPPDPAPDVVQGPDDPLPMIVLGPMPAIDPRDLPIEIRGGFPVMIEANTRRRGSPRVASDRHEHYPKPITRADILAAEDIERLKAVAADQDAHPWARARAWIDAKRHNRAIILEATGRLGEVPDVEASAQQNGRPLAVESRGSAAPEVGSQPQTSLPGPEPVSSAHQSCHKID